MNDTVKEVVVKLPDGDYTIRPGKVGDTIFGNTAHKIMFAMCAHFGYAREVPMDQKIMFILNYKTQQSKS